MAFQEKLASYNSTTQGDRSAEATRIRSTPKRMTDVPTAASAGFRDRLTRNSVVGIGVCHFH